MPLQLAVEIVSPGQQNIQRDYKIKKAEYEQIGVLEYWVVDVFEQQIVVFQLQQSDRYQKTIYRAEELVFSSCFPELRLVAKDVLNA